MLGDKLLIKEEHIKAAKGINELLLSEIEKAIENKEKFVITISGESGAGKSEIAASLAQQLIENGIKSIILQQDDYFVYPPKTNDMMRRKNINHVGTSEVKLDLLDQNLRDILNGKKSIEKPLVIYEEDRAIMETITVEGVSVVIVEGTYTTLLENVQKRVFIDRIYLETTAARKERAREEQDEYLERILKIEHDIISKHKAKADIIVNRDFEAKINDEIKK